MILLTGATSQVGQVLVKKLKNRDEKIRCFVRKTSKIEKIKSNNIEFCYGDFSDKESIKKALDGVDYLIHLGGIWYADRFLSVLDEDNRKIAKAIFVGSTSRFQKVNSEDEKELDIVKKMMSAEKVINESKQNTVILRPTMLYGIDRDKNVLKLIKIMDKIHMFPIIGQGNGMKQPVHVDDLADAIISVMYNENIVKNEYNIPGKSPIEYNDMIRAIKNNLHKPVIVMHIPVWLAEVGFAIYKRINPKTIVNKAMVKRVDKSYIFSYDEAKKDFQYSPMNFEDGVKKQIAYLKENGTIK